MMLPTRPACCGPTSSRAIGLSIVLLLALVAAACGSAARVGPVQTRSSPRAKFVTGRPAHVAVVVLENHEYGQVIGSRATPYLNSLAQRSGLAAQMYAITHPSLPNYLALTGGSSFGIGSDCGTCSVPGNGLVGQLDARAITWKAYMESMPSPCFKGEAAGEYAKKHDPFMYYRALAASRPDCERVIPLTELQSDERAHTLPTLIWITPNLCHDAHDCGLEVTDHFMSTLLPPLLRALGSNGLLFLTFDEGTTDDGCCRLASGGHIFTVVAGPGARPGARLKTPVDHYSVLQTVEDLLGLSRLRGAACVCTPSLAPLLKTGKS